MGRVADREGALGEVDVRPAQRDEFAEAHTGRQGHHPERAEAIGPAGKDARLALGEGVHPPLGGLRRLDQFADVARDEAARHGVLERVVEGEVDDPDGVGGEPLGEQALGERPDVGRLELAHPSRADVIDDAPDVEIVAHRRVVFD